MKTKQLALCLIYLLFGFSLQVMAKETKTAGTVKMSKVEYLDSGKILPRGLPFSEAVRVDNILYLSGQLGIKPGEPGLVKGGIKAEAKQTMENIKAVLATQNLTMNDLVKCTVMMGNIEEWQAFNEVYVTYFSDHFPARSAFGADGLAMGAAVEVECMAVFK